MAQALDPRTIDKSALESALGKLGDALNQRKGKIQPGWEQGSQRNFHNLSIAQAGLTEVEEKALVEALGKYSAKIENGILTVTKSGITSNRDLANFVHSMNRELEGTLSLAGTAPLVPVIAPVVEKEVVPVIEKEVVRTAERTVERSTSGLVRAGEQAAEKQGILAMAKVEGIMPAIGKIIAHHPVLASASVIGGIAVGLGAMKYFGGDKKVESYAESIGNARKASTNQAEDKQTSAFKAQPDVYAGAMHVNDRSLQTGLSEGRGH